MSMGREPKFSKYTFDGYTGYVVAPWLNNEGHNIASIRHSASVEPWVDEDVHIHENSEEYYFLLQGKLWLMVENTLITLEPKEFLQVRESVPHAVVKGAGKIEHFVIRIPATDDRKSISQVPEKFLPSAQGKQRELQEEWGYRVSVEVEANRDCWLFGFGQARFQSRQLCLAYMKYRTQKVADGYKDAYRHSFHAHQKSWEYYTVLKGAKTLRVEDNLITVNAGEILEVYPHTKHIFHELMAPFEGFTFRTPLVDDKVEFVV
jgi:mannose-6-phosphate isomerase-like protein (cupin superfamily)